MVKISAFKGEFETFLLKNPHVKTAIEEDIVNYSKLARKLMEVKEINISSFQAIVKAIVRYAEINKRKDRFL